MTSKIHALAVDSNDILHFATTQLPDEMVKAHCQKVFLPDSFHVLKDGNAATMLRVVDPKSRDVCKECYNQFAR